MAHRTELPSQDLTLRKRAFPDAKIEGLDHPSVCRNLAHCRPSLPSGFGVLRTTGNLIIRWRLQEILHRTGVGFSGAVAFRKADYPGNPRLLDLTDASSLLKSPVRRARQSAPALPNPLNGADRLL